LAQRGERGEQFAAMPDRGDPQPGQILGGQLGEDLGVDVIVAKRRGVLVEAEAAQPLGDIERHQRSGWRASRALADRYWGKSGQPNPVAPIWAPPTGKVLRRTSRPPSR